MPAKPAPSCAITPAGHSGFGANVRAMAAKGDFFAGKYQLFNFGGCDTFSYLDAALATRRNELNPDDNANGSKYMEIIATTMPSWFRNYANNAMAQIKALAADTAPKTFETITQSVDPLQLTVVTGEEDNVFKPGMVFGRTVLLSSVSSAKQGAVQSFQFTAAKAGTHVIAMTHDPVFPAGDADLRVRVGSAPEANVFDCSPQTNDSNEQCVLNLAVGAKVFITVTGYEAGVNGFVLRAFQR